MPYGKDYPDEAPAALRVVPNEPAPADDDYWTALLADEPVHVAPAVAHDAIPADVLAQMKADPELGGLVLRRMKEQQAKALLAEIEARKHPRPEPDCGTLAELLARPAGAPSRIGGLLTVGGRMLVTAMHKAGKTTLVGNLARSLLTGEEFLGRFVVEPIDGRVVVLNYEVSGAQFAAWMRDIGVPADRMFVVNLRGCRNPLADAQGRRELAEMIRQQSGAVLIVDPFGRAYTGSSQNDAAEVTPWLVRLDELTEAAGCSELVLTTHAGWNGERTRGSTALNDWPDTLVTLNKDPDTGDRFVRAEGRDVDVPEDRLRFDERTRRLSLTDTGSRAQSKAKAQLEDLVTAVRFTVMQTPGLNVEQVEAATKDRGVPCGAKGNVGKALRIAESQGFLRVEVVEHGRRLHYPADQTPDPRRSPSVPHGGLR